MISFTPNFEDTDTGSEIIDQTLEQEIINAQESLVDEVSLLVEKTQTLADKTESTELSEADTEVLIKDLDVVKEKVVGLSESGFITPEFSVRLAAIAGGMGIIYNPQILDSIPGNPTNKIVIGALLATIWGLFSVARNHILNNKAKWHTENKGYEFFEFDVQRLLERWGLNNNDSNHE